MSDTPIFDNVNNNTPRESDVVDIEIKPVTLNEDGEYTNAPQPKVIAATSGAGVGAAVATLVVWIVEITTGIDVPALVEGATAVLTAAGLGFAAGWIERP